MTTNTFWANLLALFQGNSELREAFIQEMNEEHDQNKRYKRLSLLLRNIQDEGKPANVRVFLQKMADESLLLYTLGLLKEKLNGLTLNMDPGIQQIQETDVRILQLYDINHIKHFKEKYLDIHASITPILQTVRGFLEGWYSHQGSFSLDQFHGFKAFIGSTIIQKLILILSIHFHSTKPPDQNPDILHRIALLNLHCLFWFNAFENNPSFYNSLLHGMVASIFLWILFGAGSIAGIVKFKEIRNGNRVGPTNLNGTHQVIATILNRTLQQYRKESMKAFDDFFNLLDTMDYTEIFSERLGHFFQEYRKTSSYNQTNEHIQFLVERLLDRVSSASCWNSLVDHIFMFLLAKEKLHQTLSALSDECFQQLLQHARDNLMNDESAELIQNTTTFLVLDSVRDRLKNSFPKTFLKKRLRDALSEDSAWVQVLGGQFPYLPLLKTLDQWMDTSESLDLAYTPFGQHFVESIDQYLRGQIHQDGEILIVLNHADRIFSTSDFTTFINALMNGTLDIMPDVDMERYRKIIQEFLEEEAVRKAISRVFIEELARKTIQQKFHPHLVEFLRDVLRAYVHRGKRKHRWEDTVRLRQNIANHRSTSTIAEHIERMLTEIEEMLR